MQPFAVPPPTRFDLNFSVAGFSVRVHPLFWLIALLFGISLGDAVAITLWVGIMFLSILIHELGHSIVMRIYKIDSFIVLYSFGGLAVSTSAQRSRLSWTENILISLAGPFAGFLFAALIVGAVYLAGGFVQLNTILGFIPMPNAYFFSGNRYLNVAIQLALWINIFWGLINLLPVIPLDGGHVSQQILVRFKPWDGMTYALWLSVIAGGTMAIAGYIFFDSLYMALLFGLLAVQSYQALQGYGGGRRF